MYVLGVSYSMHDSAVSLVKDGVVLWAIEEERLNRKKHTNEFPFKSIYYILKKENILIDDIDYVAFNFRPSIIKEHMLKNFGLINFPFSFHMFQELLCWYKTVRKNTRNILRKHYKYTGNVIYVDHHMAHAASAFFCSPFKKSLIVTVDGTGEYYTLAFWSGNGNKIELLDGNQYPHSLGVLYSMVTAYLGLGAFGAGKTMGLAPYGEDKYADFFDHLISFTDDGLFKLNYEYFNFPDGMLFVKDAFNQKAKKILGTPREKDEPLLQRHKDIAASLQAFLERTMLKLLDKYQKLTNAENICLAGGVALNSVLNGKILEKTACRDIFIQPAAGDSGTAIGAALFVYNQLLNNQSNYIMEHAYLGPEYDDHQLEETIKRHGLQYRKSNNVAEDVAKLLLDNHIVGWFQGRMEFGPRALGNRSILANPCCAEMKDLLNQKVKFRESFRPFAPVALEENFSEYFDTNRKSPFMLLVSDVIKKDLIPSVVHVDGSARLQTVSKKHNEKLWSLIKNFGEKSGVPVVLNTSFNIKDEPIVHSPDDAIRCFLGTQIDYLVLGDFILNKKEVLKEKLFDGRKNLVQWKEQNNGIFLKLKDYFSYWNLFLTTKFLKKSKVNIDQFFDKLD